MLEIGLGIAIGYFCRPGFEVAAKILKEAYRAQQKVRRRRGL